MKNILILNISLFLLYSLNVFSNTERSFYKKDAKDYIPSILMKSDLQLYKSALDHHKKAEWNNAEILLNKVQNKILLGYFEYEKLMHPNKYRASYQELASWYETYKDFPPVLRKRVYYLLLKRLPAKEDKELYEKPKFGNYLRGYGEDNRHIIKNFESLPRESIRIEMKEEVNKHFDNNQHSKLVTILKLKFSKERYAHYLINKKIDKLFFNGNYKESLRLFDFYINSLNIEDANFYFRAGLNAYKVNDKDKANKYFNQCRNTAYTYDEWQISSCLYWYAITVNSKKKKKLSLKEASKYPRTIYGQLAIELLQLPDPFIWGKDELSANKNNLRDFKNNKIFRRAVALTELHLYNKADLEIRNFYSTISQNELKNLFFASEELNLAAVLIRLGSKFSKLDNTLYIRGLYPTPKWHVEDGYLLDKALLFALIRRESAFNFKAKSAKGARGLMQLMPRTASKLQNDYRLRYGNAYKLYSMELNLEIGQKFLKNLISNPKTNNSLLGALIAYNAGMKRLNSWKKSINTNDPLVFIESIPIKETRWFVKYILTDLWVYRDKLGQDKPTRKLLANKKWPLYRNIDYSYIRDANYR